MAGAPKTGDAMKCAPASVRVVFREVVVLGCTVEQSMNSLFLMLRLGVCVMVVIVEVMAASSPRQVKIMSAGVMASERVDATVVLEVPS